VLDPFVGSGTAALECQLLGIDFVGIDVSPLCVLLSRAKTGSWRWLEEIRRAANEVITKGMIHPDNLHTCQFAPEEVKDFFEIARMVTYSDVSRRDRDAKRYLVKNIQNMLESVEAMNDAKRRFDLQFGNVVAKEGDARDLRQANIADDSIDAVVTSPPYSIALDYVKNDEHALEAMGLDTKLVRKRFIGVRGRGARDKLALYAEDLKQSFAEMRRVLKPGAPAVVVIGNATVDGKEVQTTDHMARWAAEIGLTVERVMPKIAWGLYGVVADEKIIFLRKK